MENCCKYIFGLYPHNFDLVLDDLFATVDGKYTLVVRMPGGSTKTLLLDAKAGDELIIPQGVLNESAVVDFKILDIFGAPLKMNDCESFQLTTFININLKCDDNNCDDSNNPSNPYGIPYGYS